IALRVTSRALELALAPAYQASTIVRNNPNAVIATTMPTTVRVVRNLCRRAFFRISRRRYIASAVRMYAGVRSRAYRIAFAWAKALVQYTAWNLLNLPKEPAGGTGSRHF